MPILEIDEECSLHYRLIEGNKERPYLVFLHEGLGCATIWRGFPDRLCRETDCPGLVYDRRGYGRSSPSSGSRTIHYLHDYALRELPALLHGVIPESRFILIGHSDGGSIALIYAAEKPSLLAGLVTEAAHVFVEPETTAGILEAVAAWKAGKLQGLSIYHGEKAGDVFRAWSDTWLSDWFESWCIEYLLPSIDVPLLAIQGVDDHYGSARQVESIVSRSSGPARSALIKNCGHAPHQESQTEVLEVMARFVKELS